MRNEKESLAERPKILAESPTGVNHGSPMGGPHHQTRAGFSPNATGNRPCRVGGPSPVRPTCDPTQWPEPEVRDSNPSRRATPPARPEDVSTCGLAPTGPTRDNGNIRRLKLRPLPSLSPELPVVRSLRRPICFPRRRRPHRGSSASHFAPLLGGLLIEASWILPSAPAVASTEGDFDWRDAIIYQVITDRFDDAEPTNNNAQGAYGPTSPWLVHGGDLAGIEGRLDYLAGLGINALWISPVVLNAWGRFHGYHAQDFHSISPQQGGLESLASLIDASHARGLRIIVDVVTNHMADLSTSISPGWPDFQDPSDYVLIWRRSDVLPAPPFDRLDWYHNHGRIGRYEDPEQILGELSGLDDLRTEVPEVRDALVDAHAWLIEDLGVDGFRIDTVKHVELDFWQEWPGRIRARADGAGVEHFFQFGEVLDGSDARCGRYTGTMGGGPFALDSVLAYPLYYTLNDVFVWDGPTAQIRDRWNALEHYAPQSQERLVTFLDNHDQPRFLSRDRAGGARARLEIASAFLLTARGIPTLYYGTEQGFDGGADPDNREDLFDGQFESGPSTGDNFDMASPLYRWIRRLAHLRQDLETLRRGTTTVRTSDPSGPGLFGFLREHSGAGTMVLLNTGAQPLETRSLAGPWPPGTPLSDLLRGPAPRLLVDAAGGIVSTVPGRGAQIWVPTGGATFWPPWPSRVQPRHGGETVSPEEALQLQFDRAMDPTSVEASLSVNAPCRFVWASPHRLLVEPLTSWALGSRVTLALEKSARSMDGQSLGVRFESFAVVGQMGFEPPPALSVAPGYEATVIIADNLRNPTSLAVGQGLWFGEILVADGDAIQRFSADGDPLGTLAKSADLRGTSAISFGPDGTLFAAGLAGTYKVGGDGSLTLEYPCPGRGGDRPLWIDGDGVAWSASMESDVFWRLQSVEPHAFKSGIRGIRGIVGGSFQPAGAGWFLSDAELTGDYAEADGGGALLHLSLGGDLQIVATNLPGAGALTRDESGVFDGDLLLADVRSEAVLGVDSRGAVRTLVEGLGNLASAGALAQDAHDGSLLILDSGASTAWTAPLDVGSAPRVIRLQPSTTGISPRPPAPAALRLFPPSPNPMNPSALIRFEVDEPLHVSLTIHRTNGALVRTLHRGPRLAGAHAIRWNGADDHGRAVSSGVYWLALRAGDDERIEKMVVLR